MAPTDHILVLGATGVSGLIFIQHVLSLPAGSRPKLTLYVRSRSKLTPEIQSAESIRIVQGEMEEVEKMSTAMSGGITAVVSFLGAYVSLINFLLQRKGPTPIADAMPTVFEAMRTHSVKRILALSTFAGFPQGDEYAQSPWSFYLMGWIMPRFVVPQGNAEMHGIAHQVAAQKDLDWTVYRVPHLNEGDKSLEVVAGFIGPDYRGSIELSRGSLALWVLQELRENKWVGSAPMLGNP